MNPREELECLLAAHLDGPAEPARAEKLAGLLHAHPHLHPEYLDQIRLHALLNWRGGRAVPQPPPIAEPRRPTLLTRRMRRGLTAALLVSAACLAALFFFHSPEAQATPDLVDRLVALNCDLAQTATPAERSRIYEQTVAPLKTTLAQATLPSADRELAKSLLENSSWLAENADPISEAERFSAIVEKLVTRMDAATQAQDEKRLVQLADSYQRIAVVGIDSNLQRAVAGPMHGDRKKRYERMTVHRAALATRFTEIVQRNPEPSRHAIHRAMKRHKKK